MGLVQISRVSSYSGWRWIFIIEGLATVVVAVLSFFIIQDFPDPAKFLTEEESTFVIRRLQEDDQFSAAGEKFRFKYVLQSLVDWKTWVGSTYSCYNEKKLLSLMVFQVFVYVGADGPLYAVSKRGYDIRTNNNMFLVFSVFTEYYQSAWSDLTSQIWFSGGV